jgi:hypothetical protein
MKQARQTRTFLPATEYRDRRVAMLPPVAVGAHMHTATKQLFDAFDGWQFVDDAGGHQEGARTH